MSCLGIFADIEEGFTDPLNKVWVDRADAQVFCRGILNLPLAKEIYPTPFEAQVETAAKNLVMYHHFTMGLIDRVHDSGRVIDNLSRLNEELWANARGKWMSPGRYEIALIRFRTKHPGLEVEEDPYVILPEDANVSMKVEVPFDD
ncbi:hypothetical protein GW17_00023852 [Ensete ventricosum]|nr:hypothetical protein GW17_00023852 [Ensete ventricosum]